MASAPASLPSSLHSEIIAALAVAHGFNARSRRQLLSIAAEHNLDPAALLALLSNLSISDDTVPAALDKAATGGRGAPALTSRDRQGAGLSEIPSPPIGGIPSPAPKSATPLPLMQAAAGGLDPQSTESPDDSRALAVALITFLLGLMLTLPFAGYVIYHMTAASHSSSQRTSTTPAADATPTMSEVIRGVPDSPSPSTISATPPTPSGPAALVDSLTQLASQWRRSSATAAADSAASPDSSLVEQWNSQVTRISRLWVRLDAAQRDRASAAITSALYDASSSANNTNNAAASAAVLAPLDPRRPEFLRLDSPQDVWSRAFSSSMLVLLASQADLPAPARTLVADFARLAFNGSPPSLPARNFSAAAAATLPTLVEPLIRRTALASQPLPPARSASEGSSSSPDPVSLWLAWGEAVAAATSTSPASTTTTITTTDTRDRVFLEAAYRLLTFHPNLAATLPTRDYLVAILGFIDFPRSPLARARTLAWFDDPQVSASNLSLFTAWLVAANRLPNLDDSFILSPTAATADRARARAKLATAWPIANPLPLREGAGGGLDSQTASTTAPSPTSSDPSLLSDWSARTRRAFAADSPSPAQPLANSKPGVALDRLLVFAQLNLAASSLEAGDADRARDTLLNIDRRLALAPLTSAANTAADNNTPDPTISSPPSTSQPPNPARAPGSLVVSPDIPDAEWAATLFRRARDNDRPGIEDHVRSLLFAHGRAIGPVDAAVLVDLAFSSQQRDIRALALEVIESRLASDPDVVLLFADSIPPDRRDSRLSLAIQRITSTTLPDTGSPAWYPEARLALLTYILQLRQPADAESRIDALSRLLAWSYQSQPGASTATAGVTDSQAGQPFGPTTGASSGASPGLSSPALAADGTFRHWLEVARPMVAQDPVPAPLADIIRRAEVRASVADGPVAAFAASQLATLETMLYVTSAERPALAPVLQRIFNTAIANSLVAPDAYSQLAAVESAITLAYTIRLTASDRDLKLLSPNGIDVSPVGASSSASSTSPLLTFPQNETNSPVPPALAAKLQTLSPQEPVEYFLRAEEALDLRRPALAARLLVLAADLDPDSLGASAALALAQLSSAPDSRQLFAAMSLMYPGADGDIDVETGSRNTGGASTPAAAMVSAMLGYYRTGNGALAIRAFESQPEAEAILTRYARGLGSPGLILNYCRSHPRCSTCKNELLVKCSACRGGADPGVCPVCRGRQFVICNACNGKSGPELRAAEVDGQLRFEIALLAGKRGSWASQFQLDRADPAPILDPSALPAWVGVDPSLTVYRNGEWAAPFK